MAGGGKGPAQLTAMAIAQYRQALIYAYNNGDYVTAAMYVKTMHSALPKATNLDMEEPPRQYDQEGNPTTQDNVKNFAFLKVKPWVDKHLPLIEHALSIYIDNFYKNNPKLANLY